MQFNYYFLRALSKELSQHLIGKKLMSAFSQNKDELILRFESTDSEFILKANLDSETSLLSFPNQYARARKNSVDLFEEIRRLEVIKLRQFENERCFSIVIQQEFELLFKLHGRHSNVLLFKNNQLITVFNSRLTKDKMLDLNLLDRPIDQSDQGIIDASFELSIIYPTFDKHIKKYLKEAGFYSSETPRIKLEIIHSLMEQLEDNKFYITEINGVPKLLLYKPKSFLADFESPIAASNFLARRFFTNYGSSKLKSSLLSQLNKDIKKCQSYLTQTKSKLHEIQNRRVYEEVANILMANLHIDVTPGTKEIELYDFYVDQQIKIKLKPNLNLQKNAEVMYRKAKNQTKEIDVLNKNIKVKEDILNGLLARHSSISELDDIKQLKAFETQTKTKHPISELSPFIKRSIDGFEVLIGKNAKNNDLLTQKFAKKNDLWLHARDVSGSHVVIKNPNDVKIALSTIEKVAQIAAWHSKRKTDSLCPVIYTPKKYVRKPKGSLPGQVLLSQEQVILVKPERTTCLTIS